MPEINCRHFSGYKPCGRNEECSPQCPQKEIPDTYILVIHLGALGSVLRSTALLWQIKKKYPQSHITWLTKRPAEKLLENNKMIDDIFSLSWESLTVFKARYFDAVFCLDKCSLATSVAAQVPTDKHFGFKQDPRSGHILPATQAASRLWGLGLSNEEKFYHNTKTELELLSEALELGSYRKQPYIYNYTLDEKQLLLERRQQWRQDKATVVGINTGASPSMPTKKLSFAAHRRLIGEIQEKFSANVVLLGGDSEQKDHESLLRYCPGVFSSPTAMGLRDGMVSVGACDIVVSGDSLGMHMAIAVQKWVVAWFGPTCSQEIELFGRGVKVLSEAQCGPCWRRACHKEKMCYDLVPTSSLISAIEKGIQWQHQTLLYKRPLLGTFSSPSPYFAS